MKKTGKAEPNFNRSAMSLSIVQTLAVCFLLIFAASSSIKALDPDKRLTQYGHTTWRVLDGYFASPSAIGQTTDGYIWIGTRDGLLRFDGVKFTRWTPPEGQALPNTNITALLGASDGGLWIGTSSGLAQLKDGQTTNYSSKPGVSGIGSIIEDETGAVWFTRYRIADKEGTLCTIKNKEYQCFGKDENAPADYGLSLAKDAAGNLWIGSSELYRWTPESSEIFFKEELKQFGGNGITAVAVNPSGQVWAALDATGPKQGVRFYSDGKWTSYKVPGFDGEMTLATALYRDRHDSLWVGSASDGLYRIHNGIADNYAMKNGLSGNAVGFIFEDREGNIWIQTENGVDMFRDTPVVNFSLSEGLSATSIRSILGLSSGSVWVSNGEAVDIIPPDGGIPAISTLKDLPGQHVESMFEDRDGRVWLSVDGRIIKYENNQFLEVKKPDGSSAGKVGSSWAMTGDTKGNIWVGVQKDNKRLLLRIRDQTLTDEIPLRELILTPESLAANRQGAIWIGSRKDKLVRYLDGQTENVSLGDAGEVVIYNLMVDSEDALWASTVKGLYRWKDGAPSLLDERNGLPCSTVFAALEDNSGNFWLYAKCGLLRIPAADMADWKISQESKVSFKNFDALDGSLPASAAVSRQRAAKSTDGRLWFLTDKAVQMIDPNRSYVNTIPPPVYIESLVADHKNYQTQNQINLPPLQNELEINFTALSYSLPRKINFRYKLENHDADWQDVGTRRQAFYNNLGPGNYRFRVIAANGNGIWNETGATLDFTIEPAWYQTNAFRFLCLLLAGLIVWALYRLRIRQISRILSARFDERLAERTRLARELHDTFLQTIQGSKLVADDALEQSNDPIRLRQAMKKLSFWLGQATDEGRAALNSLRTTTTETNDLAEALRRAADNCDKENTEVKFTVVGETKEMHPIVRDEIYRIGYEAIRNACQHSKASHLTVELIYNQDIAVRVKDNGGGIDPVVAAHGKPGHFGLNGMRERAARIGAKLTVVSSADMGTEITLTVPGAFIFRKPNDLPTQI